MTRALLLALALAGCEGEVHVESEGDDWYPGKYVNKALVEMAKARAQGRRAIFVNASDSTAVLATYTSGQRWDIRVAGHDRVKLLADSAFVIGYEPPLIVESAPIAQADPTTEADWPRLAQPCSLTVTNATPRTLLLEQAHVVTLAKPGSTQTVALEGPVTIREEASYDE